MDTGDGILVGFGCIAILWWLFIVFVIFMIVADFFDLGVAISDKL